MAEGRLQPDFTAVCFRLPTTRATVAAALVSRRMLRYTHSDVLTGCLT